MDREGNLVEFKSNISIVSNINNLICGKPVRETDEIKNNEDVLYMYLYITASFTVSHICKYSFNICTSNFSTFELFFHDLCQLNRVIMIFSPVNTFH